MENRCTFCKSLFKSNSMLNSRNKTYKYNQKVCRLLCKKIDEEILLLEDEDIVDEEKHNELEELLDNLCNNITSISNIKLDTERKFLEDFMIGICDRLKN